MDITALDLQMARQERAAPRLAAENAVALTSLTTAVPKYVLHQEDVITRVRSLFGGRQINIDRLLPAFDNAGILTRRSCVPIEWYLEPSDWKTRNQLFIDNALDLFEEATARCLEQAGLRADAVDAIVAVSTTGIAVPSLDARLMDRMPFRRDVVRLPIFGLGCAGGVMGLSRAAALAKSRPGMRVLCLVAELCALTFRANDRSKSNVIATALFGDGVAAVLLESPADPALPGSMASEATQTVAPLHLTASGEYTWPASLDVMGWNVENDGLGVVFSRDIPMLVQEHMGAALDSFLADHDLSRADIDGYVCHPGGAKVISALEEVFGLEEGNLSAARDVLRDFGNMSAVTVLFVLERMRAAGMKGRYVMTALGPGFSAGFQILEA